MTNERFSDRELSWLQFNARVLHQAIDARVPLLERVRFLQIFTSNLDEFFMGRVGSLKKQQVYGVHLSGKTGLPVDELLARIRVEVLALQRLRAECWENDISKALERQGILVLG